MSGLTTQSGSEHARRSVPVLTRRGFAGLCAAAVALAGSSALAGTRAHAEEQAATPTFEGGTGTPDDPYQIASPEQLAGMAADLTASYALTADVDLSGWGGWIPVGNFVYGVDVNMETGEMNMDAAFTGSLDGGGHAISGLAVNADPSWMCAGLFGMFCGSVRDLTLHDCHVTGLPTTKTTGCLVGYAMAAEVTGVTVSGGSTARGNNCTGCVCGGADGGTVVSGCAVDGGVVTVIGNNDFGDAGLVQCDVAECGGLVVGGAFRSSVNDCTARGTVVAGGNEPVGLGGLCGCLQSIDAVSGDVVDATVVCGNGHAVGGLCGYAGNGDDGTGTIGVPTAITGCDVTVRIVADGATHVGGLVGTGLYYFGMEGVFAISDCSVRGSIDGALTPGTVAGRAECSTIEGCEVDVLVDGEPSGDEVGQTDRMYESADQYE